MPASDADGHDCLLAPKDTAERTRYGVTDEVLAIQQEMSDDCRQHLEAIVEAAVPEWALNAKRSSRPPPTISAHFCTDTARGLLKAGVHILAAVPSRWAMVHRR